MTGHQGGGKSGTCVADTLRQELAEARRRAARAETAVRALSDRVREVEEDLLLPPGQRRWRPDTAAAAALRGARIEALKSLETP